MSKKSLFGLIVLVSIGTGFVLSCSQGKHEPQKKTAMQADFAKAHAKVTFVELGSVNCIPCQKMQPVMKSIEKKYGNQINVVFHDVWKDKRPAQQYSIRLIPTQVFLDRSGNEIMRHEGFFPESEIDQFLQSEGLIPRQGT